MGQQTLVRPALRTTIAPTGVGVKSAADSFIAAEPWSPTRPETLVICCSDGRWHAQVEEFVRAEVSERADLYAIPGGPASLNPRNAGDGNQGAEHALRFLVQEHQLASIWLIAHENCAFYRLRYGPLSGEYIYCCQKEDVARAAESIRQWFPELAVRQVYASLDGDRVVFTWLNDEWMS